MLLWYKTIIGILWRLDELIIFNTIIINTFIFYIFADILKLKLPNPRQSNVSSRDLTLIKTRIY